ncbi:Ig-like domain-containing protein [Leptospira ellisii]|uniref:Ig-like domain-containing protein n=1 Tax=Leptospira ellisii TaxID=2023197 RepID=UPI000F636FED
MKGRYGSDTAADRSRDVQSIGCVNGKGKSTLPFLAYLDFSNRSASFSVSQITPGSNVTGVSLNTSIQVGFSEKLDPASIGTQSIRLKQGGTVIAGNITSSDTAILFTPSSSLAASTVYTVTVSKSVLSESGSELAVDYTWNFTTSSISDLIPPIRSLTYPLPGAAATPNNASLSIAFSETVDCTTVNPTNWTLVDGASNSVFGSVSCAGSSATFTPSSSLAYNTSYTATIGTGIKDLAGNAMTAPYSWSFTTGAAPDSTPPSVSFLNPSNAFLGFAVSSSVSIAFTESMNCSTIDTNSISLEDAGGVAVSGTVSCSGSSVSFLPSSPLNYSSIYTVVVNGSAKDLAGLSANPFNAWFGTGAEPVVKDQEVGVNGESPAETGIQVNQSVNVVFSEPMDCSTVGTGTFQLNNGAVLGSVTCFGAIATFHPDNDLNYNTTYTVNIGGGVKDPSGNSMLASSWTFTTGNAPDSVRPYVLYTNPANVANEIAPNASITIAFSEVMDCLTVSSASIVVDDGSSSVIGTVSCSGTTATFDPQSDLSYNTNYTVTVLTTVSDLAGLSPLTPTSWSFTTGSAPDSIPPVLSLVTPSNGSTSIGVNTMVNVVFSEPIDCSTISTGTFQLNGGAVPGSVTCSGSVATFDPDNNLSYNTTYSVDLLLGIKDLANVAFAPTNWSFTTGSASDMTPPSVIFYNPLTGTTSAPINTLVTVVFSKTMNCSTVNGAFQISTGGVPLLGGTLNCFGNMLTYTPPSALIFSTQYDVSVSTNAKDLANNSLTTTVNWNFTTGSAPDSTPPTIGMRSPIHGAGGIGTNTNITIAFSETMDCSTITTGSFSLQNVTDTLNVSGTISSCVGTVATFHPDFNLAAGKLFRATVTNAVKDASGVAKASAESWDFTTGAAPDTTAPGVSILNLRNNAIVESGFVIGTASDAGGIASVEISLDGGSFIGANGTNSWSYPLSTGASTWRINSQHTISVRSKDAAGNYSPTTTVTVRQGTNKDINGDGYVDLVSAENGQGLVYLFYSSGSAGITVSSASLANRIIVGTAADEFGKAVALGDTNGDGYADVIVGAPAWNGSQGKVYVFHSSGSSGVNISFTGFASTNLSGAAAGHRFGDSVITGDTNGDGYTDLIAGAPNFNSSQGRIYVFHSAGVAGVTHTTATSPSSLATGSAVSDRFGASLATGNTNGDTYADVVVGSPGFNSNFGRVYVYHGSASGINGASANTILTNGSGTGMFGLKVAAADVSGDGFSDVISCAPVLNTSTGQVQAFVSSGGTGVGTGSLGGATVIINGVASNDAFGNSITARDVNGDGRADIIASATLSTGPNSNVYVFMTPSSGGVGAFITSASATVALNGMASSPLLGISGRFPLSTGDINGDGNPDLLVGTPNTERFYIFHGSATGFTAMTAAGASATVLGSGLAGGIAVPGGTNSFGESVY